MRYFITILFLLCFIKSFPQFAIVHDNNGYLNVRQDAQQNSKLVDKLKNGHLIYCLDTKGNWTNIDYTKNGIELNGYIYKDRYLLISKFLSIPISHKADNKIILKKDTIEITITQTKFDKKHHQFKYIKEYPDQIE